MCESRFKFPFPSAPSSLVLFNALLFHSIGLTPFSITLSYTVAGNTDTEWTEQDKADHRRFADR